MPSHRITLVFAPSVGGTQLANSSTIGSQYSWTESIYRNVDETDAQALVYAGSWLLQRYLVLTPGWRISRVRVSRFPLTRTAARADINTPNGNGRYGTNIAVPGIVDEQPYDKLVCSMSSVNGRGRAYELGGIGSDVVNAAGIYTAPGAFQPLINQIRDWLTGAANFGGNGGQPACLRIITPSARQFIGAAVLTGVVSGYTATPASPVVTTNSVLAGLAMGDIVRISGVLGLAGLNGQWTVAGVTVTATGNVVQLAPKRGRTVIGLYVAGGYLVKLAASLDPLQNFTPAQGGSRRTGSFGSRPRGRRSRRQP